MPCYLCVNHSSLNHTNSTFDYRTAKQDTQKHFPQKDFIDTYSKRAAEKSGLFKPIPAVYLMNEAEAVSNPTSPPKTSSLLPIVADSSKSGVGLRPILESMAAWG